MNEEEQKVSIASVAKLLLALWLKATAGKVAGASWTFNQADTEKMPAGHYAVVRVELVKLGGEPKETETNGQ